MCRPGRETQSAITQKGRLKTENGFQTAFFDIGNGNPLPKIMAPPTGIEPVFYA